MDWGLFIIISGVLVLLLAVELSLRDAKKKTQQQEKLLSALKKNEDLSSEIKNTLAQ